MRSNADRAGDVVEVVVGGFLWILGGILAILGILARCG